MSIRVHQLAKKLNMTSKELIAELKRLKVDVKGHMSTLDDETALLVQHELKKKLPPKEEKISPPKKLVKVKFPTRVGGLAVKLGVKPNELIKRLMKLNVFANINQSLEKDIAKSVAEEFGVELVSLPTEEELLLAREAEAPAKLVPRAPVVTMMGHIDHGKTSLLDVIRRTNVTAKEAGRITQHIGAYEVKLDKGQVTFLDTPGHEAFTAMRARGAVVTDLVVLVVAADDGVMPQTIEAIDHARAAGVPIVVAINKIDLPAADPDRVKGQLKEVGLVTEDLGGKTVAVCVSAKTEKGIDELLEMLLLEAEMLELKANPARPARGVVIEGKLSTGRGAVATVLVQNGTLRVNDIVISGHHFGKIKSMMTDRGHRIKEAEPSMPVEISGLSDVPQAGDQFFVVADERMAKEVCLKREAELKGKRLEAVTRVSLEDLSRKIKEGQIKELKLIIKADVQGSVEALSQSLEKLATKDVKLKVIHGGVGGVNESDIMLAAASGAIVIGFHVRPDPEVDDVVEREGVDVRIYDIIYEAIDDIRQAMEGMLEPTLKEVILGRAKVLQTFKVSKVGTVAGCMVQKGSLTRGTRVHLIRDNVVIYDGRIGSLKRFKDDVKTVETGFECGIGLENYNDIKVGDIIESFQIEKIAKKL